MASTSVQSVPYVMASRQETEIKEETDIVGVKRIIGGIRDRMRTTDIIKDGRIDKEGWGWDSRCEEILSFQIKSMQQSNPQAKD